MTTDDQDKARENRLRRMAGRQGYTLTKSRRRDPLAADYGLWWITNERGTLQTSKRGIDLDAAEAWLNGERS
jgi:hypothetical protein